MTSYNFPTVGKYSLNIISFIFLFSNEFVKSLNYIIYHVKKKNLFNAFISFSVTLSEFLPVPRNSYKIDRFILFKKGVERNLDF